MAEATSAIAFPLTPKTKVSLTLAGMGTLLVLAWGARGALDERDSSIKALTLSVDHLAVAVEDLGRRVTALERK